MRVLSTYSPVSMPKKALVTGGAGFIGSHLVKALLASGRHVVAYDNLSAGKRENLPKDGSKFKFVKGDVLDETRLQKVMRDSAISEVFHLAAEPDVRSGISAPARMFEENVVGLQRVLEACRKAGGVRRFVFASTSTVYGEASIVPTPEDYGPLLPISLYGATKLAGEALVSSYASSCGFDACILRFANIVGGKSSHGVIFDFVNKLRANPKRLEILGDGLQCKSYLHVSDCVTAIALAAEAADGVEVFNVGSGDKVKVVEIADIVKKGMGLRGAKNSFSGGKSGWKGDVPVMLLDCAKVRKLGWTPKLNSMQAVERTVSEILKK